MEILKFTTALQESSIDPHLVRVPSKTTLASATCPLGIHSSDISNPEGVFIVPELKRALKMPHSRQSSHLLVKIVLCYNWTTSDPQGVIFDAANQGNCLPNDSCVLKKNDT